MCENSGGSLLGGSGSLSLFLGLGSARCLLLLDVLRDELLVLGSILFGGLEALELLSLDQLLAAETLLSDETLDLGGLVVSLVTALDLALGNVLANVVLLFVKAENSGNLVLSLLEETVGDLLVGAALDLLIALLHDFEGNDSEVWASDATADGPSSSVASSLGVEQRALFLEEDACSAVLHDTLLHGETLLVVSSGNFENVAFVVLAHDITINFLSHSLFEEWTNLAFIINLNFLLPTRAGVCNIELHL